MTAPFVYTAAATNTPRVLRDTIYEIQRDPEMNPGIKAMMERVSEFASPMTAKLAGIAVHPEARRHWDMRMDKMWGSKPLPTVVNEVVIGGGLHAAIYCAVRVAMGYPKPLVLESSDHPGGCFSWGRDTGFYLNSRNRPGSLSFPGQLGALNYLPGAPIQPSDISGDEYQRSTAMGFAVRATLAMNAAVRSSRTVKSVTAFRTVSPRRYQITLKDNAYMWAERVIFATGLTTPAFKTPTSNRLLSYEGFIRRMDEPFPLRGLSRVAVLGAGDSGKTVIEALTGQGPSSNWSVSSLDYVDKIDWYSGRLVDTPSRSTWERCSRSRYQDIGRLLPRSSSQEASRVGVRGNRVSEISSGYSSVLVDDVPYDLVVDCRGFEKSPQITSTFRNFQYFPAGGRISALQCTDGFGKDVFRVGPTCDIPFSDTEINNGLDTIEENGTALFRYAERTASLAAMLGR